MIDYSVKKVLVVRKVPLRYFYVLQADGDPVYCPFDAEETWCSSTCALFRIKANYRGSNNLIVIHQECVKLTTTAKLIEADDDNHSEEV